MAAAMRRLALLRVTPEALADALGLHPSIRVVRVREENERAVAPGQMLVTVEDMGANRLPEALEGCELLVVSPDRVQTPEPQPEPSAPEVRATWASLFAAGVCGQHGGWMGAYEHCPRCHQRPKELPDASAASWRRGTWA